MRNVDLAVMCLARGETVAETAKLTGVSLRTMWRQLEDPEFNNHVRDARRRILDEAAGILAGAAAGAAKRLVEISEKAEKTSDRLKASTAILDYLMRLKGNADIEARLSQLEDALNIAATPALKPLQELEQEASDMSAERIENESQKGLIE